MPETQTTERPEWTKETPSSMYTLVFHQPDGNVPGQEEISLTRDEYIRLKVQLARLRRLPYRELLEELEGEDDAIEESNPAALSFFYKQLPRFLDIANPDDLRFIGKIFRAVADSGEGIEATLKQLNEQNSGGAQ